MTDRAEPDVIDGTAIDETPQEAALVPVEEHGVLMPVAPDEAKAAMSAYQETTRAILDKTDWQGNPGQRGSFVKKSGWRKIAKAYRLSCQLVNIRVERDEDGSPTRAEAIVRASAPNGQSQDADGYCSADEPRFNDAKGRLKLENDLRATATTRAKNRAISDLVGFGEVSAEEVAVPSGPPLASAKDVTAASAACGYLLRDQDSADAVLRWLMDDQGGLPYAAARLVIALERAMRSRTDVPEPAGPGQDADEEAPRALPDPQGDFQGVAF